MSKYKTTIPVDVAGLIQNLPKGSSINGVTLRDDRSGVDVLWEHDDYTTPYTFAVECPDPMVLKRTVQSPKSKVQSEVPVSGQEAKVVSLEVGDAAKAPVVKKKNRS